MKAVKHVVKDCLKRIEPFIHRTPVLTSTLIDDMLGAHLYFKCENFQKGGAYKIRGATNAILHLKEEERQKGVVTHSSGNFAQALSLAARNLGVKAYIIMPESSPRVKVEAVRGYGGEVHICESNLQAREALSDEIQQRTGATFLHPSNDLDVIIGQGTAAMELLQDYPDLDVVVTPVGGGGLIAGSCLAVKEMGQDCLIIGAEPFEVDDAYRSLISGKIETNKTTNTIADGLKTQLGDKNFPIILEQVDRIIRVNEDEIVQAMRLVWERMKIVIEPSSAVTLAAVLREKEAFRNQHVGLVISGGNVDLGNLPF